LGAATFFYPFFALSEFNMSRKQAWIAAATFPIWFVPVWLGFCYVMGAPFGGIATASGSILLAIVLISARTDLESRRIPNWATYTGVVWAFAINAYQTWFGTEFTQQVLGAIGIGNSLIGFAALFFGLLVVFSFSGGGAGDVKLTGAIGSYLGLQHGFEAILLAFVSCALFVLVSQVFKFLGRKPVTEPQTEEGLIEGKAPDTLMKAKVALGPYFAIGAIAVLLRESGLINFSIIGP
jgi:prepilin peptidase CpaA